MSLPFEGIRVIEAGSNLAAPTAGTALADLGAEVIKIEKSAGGDDARRYAPPHLDGMSATFRAINRNKKSITLDFKDQIDLSRLRGLIVEADVFFHNMRPDAILRLGLSGPQALHLNPRLIYGAISAYGAEGPWRLRPGYDGLAQAMSGQMAANGDPKGAPVMASGGVVDKSAGLWLTLLIAAALFRRERTGQGAIVETSLLEASLFYRDLSFAQYQASGRLPRRTGNRAPTFVPSDSYTTADKPVMVTCAGDALFERFARALGHEEWVRDERFATNSQRVAHRDVFEPMIADIFRTRSQAEWIERLNAFDVPCAPILDVDDVLVHPQIEALKIFQTTPGTSARLLGPTWRLDGERPRPRRGAPALGEDNTEMLSISGHGDRESESGHKDGILRHDSGN